MLSRRSGRGHPHHAAGRLELSEDALYAVPNSLREASYGLGARKRTTSTRRGLPGGRLRHRGRAHRRPLTGRRRDDDRVHRRRRHGRCCLQPQPLPARPDHDRGHDRHWPSARTRSARARSPVLREPLLRRAAAVRRSPWRSTSSARASCAACVGRGHLMAVVATPLLEAPSRKRPKPCARALEGGRLDWRSRACETFLVMLARGVALLPALAARSTSSSIRSPVWQERGLVDFLTTPLASQPAERRHRAGPRSGPS